MRYVFHTGERCQHLKFLENKNLFIQNKTEIQDISDLINDNNSYDIILYKNEVYGIAESLIKLYSLMEIVESYKMLHQETSGKIISIENPTVLCNMEQEKSRRL